MIKDCNTPNGRYSGEQDLWTAHDARGVVFQRVESQRLYYYQNRERFPDGRSHFLASLDETEEPWFAVMDDFGTLVRVST